MSQFDYPKVAIVASNPLRSDMTNGIMMRSLFEGWPMDRLAQIYFPVAASYPPELDLCHDYRMVCTSGKVRRFSRPNPKVLTTNLPKAIASNPKHSAGSRGRSFVQHSKQRRSLHRWLKLMQETWYAHSWVGKVLQRELEDLQPDIVYAVLGNYCLTKITCQACQRLNIPLYIHITDDYITSLYKDLPFASYLQAASQKWFCHAMEYADGHAAISPTMAEEYGRRFGKPWNWFTTLVDASAYDTSPRPEDGTIQLVYAGNLGLDRWRSLHKLASVLDTLRVKRGIKSCLAIYSTPEQIDIYRHRLDMPSIIELRGWAPPEELPQIFHNADILVHAESFDPAMTEYTKLSFSTKLSHYMMAGRCILAFGPEDLGSIRMVKKIGAGVTLGDMDNEAVEMALEGWIRDTDVRLKCGQRGREWAREWVDRARGHERFRHELKNILAPRHRQRALPFKKAAEMPVLGPRQAFEAKSERA